MEVLIYKKKQKLVIGGQYALTGNDFKINLFNNQKYEIIHEKIIEKFYIIMDKKIKIESAN